MRLKFHPVHVHVDEPSCRIDREIRPRTIDKLLRSLNLEEQRIPCMIERSSAKLVIDYYFETSISIHLQTDSFRHWKDFFTIVVSTPSILISNKPFLQVAFNPFAIRVASTICLLNKQIYDRNKISMLFVSRERHSITPISLYATSCAGRL